MNPSGFIVFPQFFKKASFLQNFVKTINPAGGGIHLSVAERGGFEPPVQLPIRQFSKLLV
jgi:hypothetical protein